MTRPATPRPPAVATLFPGYFAMVMATGIVAIGAHQQELTLVADVLYAVAAAAYVVLVALTLVRLVRFRRLVAEDLTSHAKGFAFLTLVAGTNVLGGASAVIHGWWDLAWVLWWSSLALWVVLLYATVIAVVLRSPKPGLGVGINGTWFLLTVSTESVAVLGALLLPHHPSALLTFTCVAAFLLGLVLYLIVMTMVFLRWTFEELDPADAQPPSWIAAGAVAITVLAGSNLLAARALLTDAGGPDPAGAGTAVAQLDRLAPVIEGLVVLAWATATFWFPLMVAIGVWRHLVRRVPLRYHPAYWALVFPLGMYGAATFRMLAVVPVDGLSWVPKAALAIALAAWIAAFAGLVLQGLGALRRREAAATG